MGIGTVQPKERRLYPILLEIVLSWGEECAHLCVGCTQRRYADCTQRRGADCTIQCGAHCSHMRMWTVPNNSADSTYQWCGLYPNSGVGTEPNCELGTARTSVRPVQMGFFCTHSGNIHNGKNVNTGGNILTRMDCTKRVFGMFTTRMGTVHSGEYTRRGSVPTGDGGMYVTGVADCIQRTIQSVHNGCSGLYPKCDGE